VYNLQSVIVETEKGAHSVKSFYLTGSTLTWYESGSPSSVTSIQDILELDSSDSLYRVRVLIYIQLDLSMKISTGFKFSTTTNESKTHQSTTLTLQQSTPIPDSKIHSNNAPTAGGGNSRLTHTKQNMLSHDTNDEGEDRLNEDLDSEDYDSEDDEDDEDEGEEEYGDIDGLEYPEDDGDEEYDDD
jgi:hypothetical protein